MSATSGRVIGVAWYRREDYERILEVMADRLAFPASFEEWHRKAEKAVTHVLASGDVVEPVYIDPISFPAWCVVRRLPTNAAARKRFVEERALSMQHSLQLCS